MGAIAFLLVSEQASGNRWLGAAGDYSATPPNHPSFHLLLVPGHDTTFGGTQFHNLFERVLTVDLAQDIANAASQDARFKIQITRDHNQWNEPFASYLADEKNAIITFRDQHIQEQKQLIASGEIKKLPIVPHPTADQQTSLELFGINKWADENSVDLVLHIHFNDTVRSNTAQPGPDRGFSMYVPESQLPNSQASIDIAQYVFQSLNKSFYHSTSHLIQDQNLIAIGASNTLDKPAILIEYAYIYEPQLQTPASRDAYLKKLAAQTIAGLRDYLSSQN